MVASSTSSPKSASRSRRSGPVCSSCSSSASGWAGYRLGDTSRDDPVECLRSIILPILALSLGITAVFTRYVRSAMIDVMNEDYIRSAMAEAEPSGALVHGVRNASIPLVTVAALQFGALLAGAVVVENVFVLPASAD